MDYIGHLVTLNDASIPPAVIRKAQAWFGGPLDQVLAFIQCFVEAGAEPIVLGLVADHDGMIGQLSRHRKELGSPPARGDQCV